MRLVRSGPGVALLCLFASCSTLSERAALSRGSRLYNAERYAEAAAEYEGLLETNPDHWEANYMLALSHMALYHTGSNHPTDIEHAERTIAALERCLKLEAPDKESEGKVRDFYAAMLAAMDRTDIAIAHFEAIIAEDPRDTASLARLGELYHKRGDYDRAIEYFARRAEAAPQNKEGWYTIGVLCWERCRVAATVLPPGERLELVHKGLAALERAVEVDPQYFEAHAYMGLLYRERAQALHDNQDQAGSDEALRMAEQCERRTAESRGVRAPSQDAG